MSDHLLVNLVGLLDSVFISFANGQIFVNILHPMLGLCLVLQVCLGDSGQSIAQRADIVILLFFHVFVHALHTHDCSFLLAIEHKGLLVGAALNI
jgi:hypothetical protein